MELVATGPQFLAVMVVGVAFGFGISGNVAENGKILQDFASWNGLISLFRMEDSPFCLIQGLRDILTYTG